MNLFARITKVDQSKREVHGVMAEQAADKSGEIFDYESSKPYIQKWSDGFAKNTDGVSYGNVRAQHNSGVVVGKLTSISFDDVEKCIPVIAKIVDDNEWKKVVERVYTGFSIGGKYVKKWSDGLLTRYTADPVEVSIVDNPCMYGAKFTMVKADGSVEEETFEKAAKTKRVAGKDLTSSAFAYVGDPEKTATWKLPIFDASHVRNALARFDQTQGIPEGEKASVLARIKAKAKEFGIDAEKVAKSLGDVGCLADCICHLDWIAEGLEWEAEIEGDNSPIPAKLEAIVDQLSDILIELATEETSELKDEDSAEKLFKEKKQMEMKELQEKFDALKKENEELAVKLAKATPAPPAPLTAESAEVVELKKQLADQADSIKAINEGLQKILEAPAPTKAVANANGGTALAKDNDNGSPNAEELSKLSPTDQIKFIHANAGVRELPFRPAN